jgi:hypothetical protein
MPYKVQFIGLSWFHWGQDGNMRVLLPDGRNFPNVAPHKFSISVAPDAIVSYTGWLPEQVESDQYQTQFWVPPSKVVIEGTDQPGLVDGNKQIPRLPSLRAIDPKAKFDPDNQAKKVGDLEIRQGTFEAFRMPGQDPNNCGLISALDVAHDAEITITLTEIPDPLNPAAPGAAPAVRTIVLKPGTEIAIVNSSRGQAHVVDEDDHFTIYSQLCYEPVNLVSPQIASALIAESPSKHPFLTSPNPFINGPGCSNVTM